MSTQTEHFSKLADGMVNYVVPPNIESMLTGVQYVKQDNTGRITLVYTDGTEESYCADSPDLARDIASFASVLILTGYIQQHARRVASYPAPK